MAGLYKKYFRPLLVVGDLAVLNACYIIITSIIIPETSAFSFESLVYLLGFNLVFFLLSVWSSVYDIPRRQRKRTSVGRLLKAIVIAILIVELIINITDVRIHSYTFLIWFYSSSIFVLSLWRYLLLLGLRYYRLIGYNYRKVIIAGYTSEAVELANYFDHHPEYGYRFLGFFDNDLNQPNVQGKMDSIIDFIESEEVDEVYCCATKCNNELTTRIMSLGDHVKVQWIPELDFANRNMSMDFLGSVPILTQRQLPANNTLMRLVKRAFDIVFSLLVIVFILTWLIPILAILIKLDSKGPVFFKQKRTGLNNKPFLCYKLRTMQHNNPDSEQQASKDDDRITQIGQFLRKSNLDEIPQFFNVFLGHMSIVGPRPHMVEHTHHYSRLIDQFMVRHVVKPGITGLSQVKGFRGETVDPILMKSRIQEDIYYMFNWSLLLDLKIILLTVLNMIKGEENAY